VFEKKNLKTTGGAIFGFSPQNLVGVLAGTGGDTLHHREACVKVKQSREELVAIGPSDLKLNHYAPRVKWFSSINKIEVVPNQPSL
jgi:hypothetical protein